VRHNIPLAVVLAVVGSFCFALAATVQHSAVRGQVDENQAKRRLSFGQILRLLRDGRWWLGIGLMGVSLACQVLGLSMAPVSVVQPVGLLAFLWSVVLSHRTLGQDKWAVIRPTVLTVVATAAFVLVVSAHAAPPSRELDLVPVLIAAGVVYAVAAAFALLGSHGVRQWRCLFWASGGALFYGLEAALVRSLFEYAAGHVWWQSPIVWVIIPALMVGSGLAGLLIQQGYATGPANVVVASMTVTSPVIAVLFGVAVLGEGRLLTWPWALVLIALGAVAVGGVVTLARAKQAALGAPSASDEPSEQDVPVAGQ